MKKLNYSVEAIGTSATGDKLCMAIYSDGKIVRLKLKKDGSVWDGKNQSVGDEDLKKSMQDAQLSRKLP